MDYNIYIHSSEGGRSNPTTPKETPKPTDPWKPSDMDDEGGGFISQGMDFIKKLNPSQIASSALRLVPYAAAAYACVKVAKKCMDLAHYFYETDTGDYHNRILWDNARNQANRLFHPISTALQDWQNYHNEQLMDRKQAQYRELLGDSYINKYGRGV